MPDFVASDLDRPSDFRELARKLSPGWLKNKWGERWIGGSIGLPWDMLMQACLEAVQARSLRSPDFPTDGLDYIGSERALPRFPNESHAAYKARLLNAWNIWQRSGTAGGIIYLLSQLGITAHIVRNSEWNWDGNTAWWSRFWVVITDHPWTAAPPIGTLNPIGNGTTIGTTATPDEVRAVRNIVRSMKGGHEVCSHIIIVLDLGGWNADPPDGTWDNVVNRSVHARYWPG